MKFGNFHGWLLGVVAYFVFLAGSLPADYVAHWVSRRAPSIQFSGVSGSLFSGQADELSLSDHPLGAIDWHFDWLAPLTATVGYRIRLHTANHDVEGRVDTRFETLYLRDVSGRLPVASLDPWSPLPPHSLDGDMDLKLRQLTIDAGHLTHAVGDVDLTQAVLDWPTHFTLGSYQMILTDARDGVHAAVNDVSSPLSLHADLMLNPKGAYSLNGTLAAHDATDTATRRLLAYLGAPDSTGRYPFSFKGQL